MASDDKQSQGKGMSLPGQPTEEAVAEVGSEAGKSLVRGLSRLGNATLGGWLAKREARAEATRLAIETDAKIEAANAVVGARRAGEMAELEHQNALQRRAERFRIEMAREQLNLEAIERRALEYTEHDPSNAKPREIDEDWLFNFADFAQRISDKEVQALWGRALSSSAIEGTERLSAAALQLLSLIDAKTAEQFKKFVAAINTLGAVPVVDAGSPSNQSEPQSIDLYELRELGLITNIMVREPLEFLGAKVGGHEDPQLGTTPCFGCSKRGLEIARAVFRGERLGISPELQLHYAKNLVGQKAKFMETQIVPLKNEEYRILISFQEARQVEWRNSPILKQLEPGLMDLLDWADTKGSIGISKIR